MSESKLGMKYASDMTFNWLFFSIYVSFPIFWGLATLMKFK